MDKISYALGLGIGQQLKSMNIKGFNIDDFSKSIADVMNGEPTLMTAREAQEMLNEYFATKAAEQSKEAIASGAAFLENNGKREGVTTTKSGLQYEVITEGKGDKPAATNTVKVHYKGTTIAGKVFDSSYDRGTPAEFPLNRVIAGWTEGLQLMSVGSKYKFYIPYNLAYGERGAGQDIKPFETLIFEVELLEIKK